MPSFAVDKQLIKIFDRVAHGLGGFLIRARRPLLFFFSGITLFLGYFAVQIDLDAGFTKSLPENHDYMKIYQQYAPMFGGGNLLTLALMKQDGDIFTPDFMRDLEALTSDVNAMPGIDQTRTMSIFSPTAILINVDETGFTGFRIVPSDFDASDESIAQVRERLVRSNEVGRLVSKDLSGALVFTEISERVGEKIDYRFLGERLEELRDKYTKEGQELHIIGFAKFISDVIDGAGTVILFFGIACLLTALLLYFYTNSVLLAAVSVAAALMAVLWALGIVRLLGYGLDPLSILVPFLIFSIGVSHAVQMANAWRIAISDGNDSTSSARIAFEKVFIPGTTALFTTAVGFGVIIVIDIPMIRELAVTASISMIVMIVTNKFVFPLMLCLVKPGTKALKKVEKRALFFSTHHWWPRLGMLTEHKTASIVLLAAITILGYGLYARQDLIVGDLGQGVPEFRDSARYNKDIRVIQDKFSFNNDELVVIAELADTGCVDFRNMYWVDRFHAYMEQHPRVAGVESLAGEIRFRYMGNNEGHPAFFDVPRNPYNISAGLARLEIGQRMFNGDCTVVPVRVFATDHNAETLESLVEAVEEFQAVASEAEASVRFRLAAGGASVMAATNDAVEAARLKMLLILYVAVLVLCYLTFMSLPVALCVLIPLILVSQFAEAVMAWLGIGLKVSTLPVLALGAGVGVDYGIYLFSRTQSGIREGLSLRDAYVESLRSVGGAVVFTALTMTLGVVTWIVAPLKLQADMGLLLAYMFFVNMVAAVTVMPALASWIIGRRG